MAYTVPQKRVERVAWFSTRLASWTTNATAIGTSDTDVADFDTKLTTAQAARDAQELAMAIAKTKTAAFYAAVEAVSIAGAGIIKQIRAKGETTGDPSVWELGMIPAPPTPEPKGPPGTPSNLTVVLNGNGSLNLKWKCPNPAGTTGTVYQVWRRFGGVGEFTYLSGSGGKTYTDNTIPAGETQVTYMIQAVRSTAVGMWATFNVNFGTNVSGTTTATVTESANSASPKLAA